MHELSLSTAIVDTVLRHAAGRRVRVVSLRVGALRQVVPDSLTFAWEVLTQDGPFAAVEVCGDEAVAPVAIAVPIEPKADWVSIFHRRAARDPAA